jgi:hypothetical protein
MPESVAARACGPLHEGCLRGRPAPSPSSLVLRVWRLMTCAVRHTTAGPPTRPRPRQAASTRLCAPENPLPQVPQFLLEAGYGCPDFPERAGQVGVLFE